MNAMKMIGFTSTVCERAEELKIKYYLKMMTQWGFFFKEDGREYRDRYEY